MTTEDESRETLCAGNTPSRAVTRAAERYLEQYGDPLVMNTYLKVTILILALVCLMLGILIIRSQKALANIHPLVIRIDDVGHAEAVDFRNFQYRPKEAENKYYLSRWAQLFFGRNRYTIQRDFTDSLYFLNADVQRAVLDEYHRNKTIDDFIHDSTQPYVDIEVTNIILDNLQESPYSARIEFLKIYTNSADHTEIKRERWTASVTYVFHDVAQNNEIEVNPLGLTIINFRADQAFD
jgi:type IV secretory pathway TrbF-like protein